MEQKWGFNYLRGDSYENTNYINSENAKLQYRNLQIY